MSRVIKHDDDCSENKMADYLLFPFSETKVKFLTMLLLIAIQGVPIPAIAPKMMAEGLDPSLLE